MKHYRIETNTWPEVKPFPPVVTLSVLIFEILSETPKGYWIVEKGYVHFANFAQSHKIWVPKKSKRRYAYPTIDEAIVNFEKRLNIRKAILEKQLSIVDAAQYELSKQKDEIKLLHNPQEQKT